MFISYGQQSNDSLLQYYGFVEPRNPHDTYVVPDLAAAVGPALAAARLPSSKVQLTKSSRGNPSLQQGYDCVELGNPPKCMLCLKRQLSHDLLADGPMQAQIDTGMTSDA